MRQLIFFSRKVSSELKSSALKLSQLSELNNFYQQIFVTTLPMFLEILILLFIKKRNPNNLCTQQRILNLLALLKKLIFYKNSTEISQFLGKKSGAELFRW